MEASISSKLITLPITKSVRSFSNNHSKASLLLLQDKKSSKKKMQLFSVNCNNLGDGSASDKEVLAGASNRDAYEGIRTATKMDLLGIKQLMQPLEEAGILIKRTENQIQEALDSFIVVERYGSIIACAALFLLFEEKCGEVAAVAVSPECRGHGQGDKLLEKSGEVAAVAVSPECRGHGQGDKLLDYIEKKAASLGLEKLFLLTTQTGDWFVRRGFTECSIESIPEIRRKRIDLSRGSKYYMKWLQPRS